MEANSNKDNETFKHPSRNTYSENSPSSNNGAQWQETQRDHRRDYTKNRDRMFPGTKRENFQEEKHNVEKPQQLVQQPAPYPAYGYNTIDHPYIDSCQRTMSMMNSYNVYAAMNNNMQWSGNSMDGMAIAPNNMPLNPSSTSMPMPTGMEMAQTSNSTMHPYGYMGCMPGDNMFGMMGMGNYCHYGMMNSQGNVIVGRVKEVEHLTRSVLYPPISTDPPPTVRNKPPGCKTVYVGGLPEEATEEIIREVFERCGEILTIRMSKKNFCHVQFADEIFVEHAIQYSGYRIKIENKDDQPYTGKLHVDYAQARSDEYDYLCQQRAKERETRHRKRQAQEYFKVPTPPPVVHYSEHEATVVGDKLRNKETFEEAATILMTWLVRGECNKKNAGTFYSMIQSAYSHVRRLENEKLKYESELEKAKQMSKKQMHNILLLYSDILKVFNTACSEKVFDNFCKSHKSSIEMWKNGSECFWRAHVREAVSEREEDEMDLSEGEEEKDEGAANKTQSISDEIRVLEEAIKKKKEDNENLQCQLKACENETETLKSHMAEELSAKDRRIKELLSLQTTSNTVHQKSTADETQLKEPCTFKSRNMDKDGHQEDNDHSEIGNIGSINISSPAMDISENDVRLIGLISTFLNVHPLGANVDYICSYLHETDSTIQSRDVEALLKRFPTIFREKSTGIGASLEKKWIFLSYRIFYD